MIRLISAGRDLPSSAQGGRSLRTGLRPFRLCLLLHPPHRDILGGKGRVIVADLITVFYPAIISTLAFIFSIFTFGYNIWRGQPRIKIAFPHESVNIIFQPIVPDQYRTDSRICLYVQIANLSSNPVSISHFSLRENEKLDDIISESFIRADEDYPVAQYPNGAFYTIPIGKEQIIPPVKISPYSIVIGYVFFAVNIPTHPFSGTLTAHTPTKDFFFDLEIKLPTLPHEQTVAVLRPKENTQETEKN